MGAPPLYTASVPVFLHYLDRLEGMVGKTAGREHLLQARLAPDMFTAGQQVATAAGFALRIAFPLAGRAVPAAADHGLDRIGLGRRIVAARQELRALDPAEFAGAEGRIMFDADDVSKSSVEVTLPLSGLNSFVADFDTHLRSADFFEADKYPAATFRSTSVEAAGPGKLKVTGDLTIKDNTHPVVLDVTMNRFAEHPMLKRATAGFDATTTIKRSDFGVGMFAPNVSDEVQIRITTEAVVAEDAEAAGPAA